MKTLQFVGEYIKHPRVVGAVMPSSKALAKQMIRTMPFQDVRCIIEYGPGTGVFTEEIIRRKASRTIFLVIETNPQFHAILKEKYQNIKNVHIIHGSAEHVNEYVEKYEIEAVDYIVSGLPFTSLPVSVSEKILTATVPVLGDEGNFITFQYSKIKRQYFKAYFQTLSCKRVWLNVPPAYVFTCHNGLKLMRKSEEKCQKNIF
ncbi:class I SAM-dependent methyltransferase [Priestia koreensis]|uniref:class I SAM-dependent methyltransferase n=1 Tax=Priestia koreensis TaxID=284581 RepID=UPI003015C0B2